MKYFIAGLPRSGSTLLSSILIQNPSIHSDVTSPVHGLFNQILSADYSGATDLITELKTKQILESVFNIAYSTIDKPIIFDLNRLWTSKLDILFDLYPNTKIICCVRDIISILNSCEHLYQANKYKKADKIYGGYIDNVYFRSENLMNWSGLVGAPLCALKQALASSYKNEIHLIEYDDLVNNTSNTITELYSFLNIKHFSHTYTEIVGLDSSKISNDTSLLGLHAVRPQVEKIDRNLILPGDLVNTYSNMEYWRYV